LLGLAELIVDVANQENLHHSHVNFSFDRSFSNGNLIIDISNEYTNNEVKNEITILNSEKIGKELWG